MKIWIRKITPRQFCRDISINKENFGRLLAKYAKRERRIGASRLDQALRQVCRCKIGAGVTQIVY